MDMESLLIILGIAFVLALITCFAVKSTMKSARIQKTAIEYITEEGVDYRIRQDQYTHTTRMVTKIPKADKN